MRSRWRCIGAPEDGAERFRVWDLERESRRATEERELEAGLDSDRRFWAAGCKA